MRFSKVIVLMYDSFISYLCIWTSDSHSIEPIGVEQLRMSFPTVTANTSPMSVLPSWVEVLGKKIDKIQAELDHGEGILHCCN